MFESVATFLQERTKPLAVFFRDDDADREIAELRSLDSLFTRHQAPATLAVIPGTLTPECAAFLRSRPHLEAHQHGWMHTNHELHERKCEFGPSRTFEQQLVDIARGMQRMNDLFEASWTRAFTPPWNRCTDDTCRALDELGYLVLSRDATAPPAGRRRFREISVSVDIFRWKGGAQLKSEEEIAAELIASAARGGPVGVLLHHKVMDEAAFHLVGGLLAVLRGSRLVYFHTLASLAQEDMQ